MQSNLAQKGKKINKKMKLHYPISSMFKREFSIQVRLLNFLSSFLFLSPTSSELNSTNRPQLPTWNLYGWSQSSFVLSISLTGWMMMSRNMKWTLLDFLKSKISLKNNEHVLFYKPNMQILELMKATIWKFMLCRWHMWRKRWSEQEWVFYLI